MNVTIYTKSGCPWAAGAKAFLEAKNVAFEERIVDKNPEHKKEVEEATGQSASPTLNIGGKWVPDAGLEDIDEAL